MAKSQCIRIRDRKAPPGTKDKIIEKAWWGTKPPYYDDKYMVVGDDGNEPSATVSSAVEDATARIAAAASGQDVAPANEASVEDEPMPADNVVLTESEVDDLTWQELKTYAAEHGVNSSKKKRDDIVEELREAGAITDEGA